LTGIIVYLLKTSMLKMLEFLKIEKYHDELFSITDYFLFMAELIMEFTFRHFMANKATNN